MSENSVENAVNVMFEAADKASQAGVVVDWRSTCMSLANSLLQEIGRLEKEVFSAQEAMKEVLNAGELDDDQGP